MPEGTNPAFGESVQIRTPWRKGRWPYSAGPQDIQKRSAEFCIPIMKQVAHAMEESRTLVGGVASRLNHPLGVGMLGQDGETEAARFQVNEEQDVVGGETSPGEHFDCEEVGPARTAM